jgi:hypothetical protein
MLSILHDVAHDASSKAAVISPISSPEEPRQPQEAERLEKGNLLRGERRIRVEGAATFRDPDHARIVTAMPLGNSSQAVHV